MKPVILYGDPVLRRECMAVNKNDTGIRGIIDDMWETLEKADGCGLAALQINIPVKLFIVNSRDTYLYLSPVERNVWFQGDTGIKESFINAEIVEYGKPYRVEKEGCLSIPGFSGPVRRAWSVTVKYLDKDFRERMHTYSGYTARIIQHEFDHTQGRLYIDHLSASQRDKILHEITRQL